MGQDQGDDEAGAVIEERGDVHPLVAPQEKREQVGLPELVRLRPLEPPPGRPRLRP
jgi:hypothetical protein